MDASVFCTDVGVRLGLAEVHSDRVRGAGELWGGVEARSKKPVKSISEYAKRHTVAEGEKEE